MTALIAAQTHEDLLEEVVGEWSLGLHALELHRDGARLRGPDPDGEHARPVLLPEDDDGGVGGAVEAQMGHGDFDHA